MGHRNASLLAAASLLLAACALGAAPPSSWKPPHEARLTGPGEPGEPFTVEGYVLSGVDGKPRKGVRVHAYHADAKGSYTDRPGGPNRLAGDLVSGSRGQYAIRSILPGLAEGNPHVHFQLATAGGSVTLVTLNLCRTHGAGSDTAFERIPYFATLPRSEPPGYWAKVERAAGAGFICRWNLPVPASMGSPAK